MRHITFRKLIWAIILIVAIAVLFVPQVESNKGRPAIDNTLMLAVLSFLFVAVGAMIVAKLLKR